MPLKFLPGGKSKWPRSYGFQIYGKGPSYVVAVEAGSTAVQSGLAPGDQLLELAGQDVTSMGAAAIKALAKRCRQQPPALEVVSCLSRVQLEPRGLQGYGFAVLNERPVVVGAVDFGSSAYENGLRVGDIILEVNGRPPGGVEAVGNILAQRSSILSLLIIPVGRSGNMVHVDKGLNRLPTTDPRVHRARDLYDKLGDVLGEDYERKMAVVAILKQYAEDRDVDILCRSLDAVLNTPHSRTILRHIRSLVSPHQRPVFDEMLSRGVGVPRVSAGPSGLSPARSARSTGFPTATLAPPVPSVSIPPPPPATPTTHTVGTKKVLQVMREDGSFGFVVKGCNPAYIESVDLNGPADEAGLIPGDYLIKLNGLDVRHCDHDHLIQLLQDSGSSPTLQVLRCHGGQHPLMAGSLTSLSTTSSESSHGSDLMPFELNHVDSDGKTFTQHAEFLLTSRERQQLKKALQKYELNRDVVALQAGLELVLDTPTKCTLWKFILVSVQPQHHDYILHRVGLPRHVLTELINQPHSRNLEMFTPRSNHGSEAVASSIQHLHHHQHLPNDSSVSHGGSATFQNHIDFLLTSRERLQFKAAVDTYQSNQDLQQLMEVMGLILDTPSKRMLWRYILPLLIPAHQGVVSQMMDVPNSAQSVSGLSRSGMDSYIGSYDGNSQQVDTATNTDEDILYGEEKEKGGKADASSSEDESSDDSDSVSDGKPVKLKTTAGGSGRAGQSGLEDTALMEELVATRRAVEEVKEAIRGRAEEKDEHDKDDDNRNDSFSAANDISSPPAVDAKHFVTIIPVGYPGFDVSRRPFYSKEMDSPEFSKLRKFVKTKPGGGDTDKPRPSLRDLGFRKDDEDRGSGSDSDQDLVCHVQADPRDVSFGFNHGALVALKELDDVMADEVTSDPDSPRRQPTMTSSSSPPEAPLVSKKKRHSVTFAVPPAPPVPPPALPVRKSSRTLRSSSSRRLEVPRRRLKSAGSDLKGDTSGHLMNVKRINWEKLDNKNVGNTIWEQLCDSELTEVIRYLELESQFSTKPPKPTLEEAESCGEKDRKKEVCIMNPKKAYNISILLGHLKMSVPEIRQAVYLMDEETLTPELLQQLIAYAPSKQEMAHYDTYKGEVDELSKPDQFSYEMSQVYGYDQRLKSLLFKANFREKIEEMKENMRSIRVASHEVRHSKKLARLLELILAMGNYMNKGNTRVGEAAGFRITFLTQLDITKTSDSKSTFLHVLAGTCNNKFPDLLTLADDLGTLTEAAKVSLVTLNEELHELRKGIQDISTALDKIGSHAHPPSTNDHFQDVMGHFISEASDDIQGVMSLQAGVTEEFNAMVTFFGEDPALVTSTDIFNIFHHFLEKFERAHRHNMMYKRH